MDERKERMKEARKELKMDGWRKRNKVGWMNGSIVWCIDGQTDTDMVSFGQQIY